MLCLWKLLLVISLLKVFKEIEDKHRISDSERIKKNSKSGTKLSNILVKKDPFNYLCKVLTEKPCVEGHEEKDFPNCRKMNVNYTAECKPCNKQGKRRVYIGETYRNIHVRSGEHYNAMKNKNKNSWMYQHIQKEHNGDIEKAKFKWKVTGSFQKAMLRQISEAVAIQNTDTNECLNLKTEYFSHKTNRLKIGNEEDEKKYLCRFCNSDCGDFNQLKFHINNFHKRLQCNKCEYSSFGKKDYDVHTAANHPANDN